MILCCGEALIDMLPRQTADGAPAFAPHVGGSVFNTAIALGRLEVPVQFLSGLSTDLFGRMLEAALAESGVDAGPSLRSDRPTTLAFVELVEGQARYAFYDENTAARMLQPGELPAPGEEVSALFFGGISLVAEPCGSAYEALARQQAGRRAIMLDPNIRPGFVTDEPGYRARIARMIAAADIVKLSDEDLRWLEGADAAGEAARRLLERGPALVCVTEGARGATGYTRAGAQQVPAPKVRVADTVGAGDTFNAGLLAGLHRAGVLAPGLPALGPDAFEEALALGVRAAAVTVSRAGANPPRAGEL